MNKEPALPQDRELHRRNNAAGEGQSQSWIVLTKFFLL
jgi:hypothetical protein